MKNTPSSDEVHQQRRLSGSLSLNPSNLGIPDLDHQAGLSALSDRPNGAVEVKIEPLGAADSGYDLVFDPGHPLPTEFERPIFHHFWKKPYHSWRLRAPIHTGRLMKNFSSCLMRSEIGWNPKGPQEVHRLLFHPRPDVFIHVEAGELIAYAATREQITELRESLLGYVEMEAENRPKFMLINVHAGGAYVNHVEVDQFADISSEDLPLYYGQDFPEWERLWLERMNRRSTGLSIFTGPTGTGKTTYLRSLVRRFAGVDTHCFYYVPGNPGLGRTNRH